MASSGSGLLPGIWVQGFAPPRAFGRAAASPQTRQMRCWPSSERTTNPSSRRKRQDSLSLSLVLFPPKPLRWVSAGTLLGAVIKAPVKGNLCAYWEQQDSWRDLPSTAEKQDVSSAGFQGIFSPFTQRYSDIPVWGVVSLPSGCCGCVGTTPRGVYFGRKTAFSEWVLCTDGRAVPSCTQCFFGTSVWGVVSLPSACASCR